MEKRQRNSMICRPMHISSCITESLKLYNTNISMYSTEILIRLRLECYIWVGGGWRQRNSYLCSLMPSPFYNYYIWCQATVIVSPDLFNYHYDLQLDAVLPKMSQLKVEPLIIGHKYLVGRQPPSHVPSVLNSLWLGVVSLAECGSSLMKTAVVLSMGS